MLHHYVVPQSLKLLLIVLPSSGSQWLPWHKSCLLTSCGSPAKNWCNNNNWSFAASAIPGMARVSVGEHTTSEISLAVMITCGNHLMKQTALA